MSTITLKTMTGTAQTVALAEATAEGMWTLTKEGHGTWVFSRGVWDYLNFVLGFSNPKPGFSCDHAKKKLIPRKKVGGFL